jgi:hypothetical protein
LVGFGEGEGEDIPAAGVAVALGAWKTKGGIFRVYPFQTFSLHHIFINKLFINT